ncbi:hypothetical protein SLOPH_888 [Spraguea lophii 42_110]|uniref:Uncharacterized protein n=1 Tax=Spraguea lophii (strain 42_110) TaxID=1358809 RepID=S7WAU0_SPRLO|nr:hypothetical protein SLOPH_888 [Spraguea lophii 42_110]
MLMLMNIIRVAPMLFPSFDVDPGFSQPPIYGSCSDLCGNDDNCSIFKYTNINLNGGLVTPNYPIIKLLCKAKPLVCYKKDDLKKQLYTIFDNFFTPFHYITEYECKEKKPKSDFSCFDEIIPKRPGVCKYMDIPYFKDILAGLECDRYDVRVLTFILKRFYMYICNSIDGSLSEEDTCKESLCKLFNIPFELANKIILDKDCLNNVLINYVLKDEVTRKKFLEFLKIVITDLKNQLNEVIGTDGTTSEGTNTPCNKSGSCNKTTGGCCGSTKDTKINSGNKNLKCSNYRMYLDVLIKFCESLYKIAYCIDNKDGCMTHPGWIRSVYVRALADGETPEDPLVVYYLELGQVTCESVLAGNVPHYSVLGGSKKPVTSKPPVKPPTTPPETPGTPEKTPTTPPHDKLNDKSDNAIHGGNSDSKPIPKQEAFTLDPAPLERKKVNKLQLDQI